ncbi:MAG: alpha/beta fold hydrolase [Burkholderiaceae bacterium]
MTTPTVRQCLFALLITACTAASAQIAPPRTWPELKQAVQERTDSQRYPMTGFDSKEVAEILDRIQSLDRDEWARSWVKNGDLHMKQAQLLTASSPALAREAYMSAWRYYGFGAWPTQNTAEKKRAHALATSAFRAYANLASPAMEVVRIPFEGKEIIGYLQRPLGVDKPPLVITIGGLDSYKEFVVDQYGASYLKSKLAYLALDMPGTGESPVKIAPGVERLFSRVIDAMQNRTDIDPERIGFQGGSWGGHWSVRMAYAEPVRLKAVVNWAGPVHTYFQREWQLKALGTREYLFDLFPARAAVYGVDTLEDFLAYGPKMSMKDSGALGKPSAPMLLVNGEKDTQVPIDDLYILLKQGAPKESWVNPEGGHIGRGKDWSDARIQNEVMVPWLARKLSR